MPAPARTLASIRTAAQARDFFAPRLARIAHERLCVAHLDRDGGVLGTTMADGDAGHAEASIRGIMADALRLGAEAMVLAHNHPGGSPEPSAADIRTTERLAGVAASLGIALRDHLILAPDGRAVSLRARGLL